MNVTGSDLNWHVQQRTRPNPGYLSLCANRRKRKHSNIVNLWDNERRGGGERDRHIEWWYLAQDDTTKKWRMWQRHKILKRTVVNGCQYTVQWAAAVCRNSTCVVIPQRPIHTQVRVILLLRRNHIEWQFNLFDENPSQHDLQCSKLLLAHLLTRRLAQREWSWVGSLPLNYWLLCSLIGQGLDNSSPFIPLTVHKLWQECKIRCNL